MRYWKGTYDEDAQRDHELRYRDGVPVDDPDRADLWIFRLLVAFQVALFSLVVLAYVDWK